MTRVAILLFALIVLTGPVYTVVGYNVLSNLISELGAQKTQNNFIMIGGFLLLGAGIIIDSFKKFSFSIVPFLLFGFFMVIAGISPHKPIDQTLNYNTALHNLHSVSATLAGISITAGFIWQGVLLKHAKSRAICFYLAIVCFAFPMLMLARPDFQGIIQRLMYLQILGWVYVKYPEKILADRLQQLT